MQALLAARLVTEGWTGGDVQKAALKEGLGMTDIGEELWGPLGKITMQVCYIIQYYRHQKKLLNSCIVMHKARTILLHCRENFLCRYTTQFENMKFTVLNNSYRSELHGPMRCRHARLK
jgi:hypothetical protein